MLIGESWFNEVREKQCFLEGYCLRADRTESLSARRTQETDRGTSRAQHLPATVQVVIYLLVLSTTGVSGKRGFDSG